MIPRFAFVIAAVISALSTWWIYQRFEFRWKGIEDFRRFSAAAPIEVRHLMIAPASLRLAPWEDGDRAIYTLKSGTEEKEITYDVAIDARNGLRGKWLVTSGVSSLYGQDSKVCRLVTEENVRLGSELAGFFILGDEFPIETQRRPLPAWDIDIEWLNDETLKIADRPVRATRGLAQLISPQGKKHPLLEIWVNPSIRPFGIVRARWRDQTMELKQHGRQPTALMSDKLLKSLDVAHSAQANSCGRCHTQPVGGVDVKLESPYLVSGEQLRLPAAAYHLPLPSLRSNQFDIKVSVTSTLQRQDLKIQSPKGSFTIYLAGGQSLSMAVGGPLLIRGDLQFATSGSRVGVFFETSTLGPSPAHAR